MKHLVEELNHVDASLSDPQIAWLERIELALWIFEIV